MIPTPPLAACTPETLFEAIYDDLKQMAHQRLRRGHALTLLDTTALVHETWFRLSARLGLLQQDRQHFFAYAAQAMRSVVVDAVRERAALRRGGDAVHMTLDTQLPATGGDEQVLRVHEALLDLETLDPRLARVVELRYFVGLDEVEAAEAMGVSRRTLQRDWSKARALLWEALQ
ncbi:ECF-type sigma factor [Dyella sp. C9]|uniref:ECF-type sigma factor n=1 Tax=Dyella sp. C9 TaxID=2202154 RepID=UPI001300A442|nr:ECF-type sigma factor [Dyella sp. C9]